MTGSEIESDWLGLLLLGQLLAAREAGKCSFQLISHVPAKMDSGVGRMDMGDNW